MNDGTWRIIRLPATESLWLAAVFNEACHTMRMEIRLNSAKLYSLETHSITMTDP